MKPHIHAKSSAEKFGGTEDDYIEIHNFLDSSKAHLADCRHRAILHSTFGCYIAERVFGDVIINKDGKEVSVRDICEQHIFEDLGKIPSVQDWLSEMNISQWMSRFPIDEKQASVEITNSDRIKALEREIAILKADKLYPTFPTYPTFPGPQFPGVRLGETLD